MTSTTFFFVFIPILAVILLAVNLIFAPHNPYLEKDSVFECGFSSFLGQNRTQFNISFFIFALLFLLFDLEVLLIYPYVVSAYTNGIYGLAILLVFFVILTLGFVFELGKGALKISSRQDANLFSPDSNTYMYIGKVSTNSSHEPSVITKRFSSSVLNTKPSQSTRSYSSLAGDNDSLKDKFLPAATYINVESSKVRILEDNQKKSGVYMWENRLNGKKYIGSAVDLSRRLSRYYLPVFMQSQLARGGKSAIYSAILKHGYLDFSLSILEYCEASRVLEIEQKYMDLYKPEYNLLLIAGSRQGQKASDETRAKMSKSFQGRVVSDEARRNIAAAAGTSVIVLDLKTNTSTKYVSISDVGRHFGVYAKKINRCIRSNKLYLDRYQIVLAADNPEYQVGALYPNPGADLSSVPASSEAYGESMQTSLLLSAKPLFMYDTINKECIYKAESQSKLVVDLGISGSNILLSLDSGQPYLGRFIFSHTPLVEGEYAFVEKVLEVQDVLELIKGVGLEYRLAIIKSLTMDRDLAKPKHELGESKVVKVTNIVSGEVHVLDSIHLTAKYIRLLDPAFKSSVGMIAHCLKEGKVYKNIFKFEEIL